MQLIPIGVMHCHLQSPAAAPRNYDESTVIGTLEIYPQFREALDGVEAGQTVVALFWLHEARRDLLKVYPRGDRSRGLRGVFATRSPVRPNPIALSELRVLAIDGTSLTVTGVDVIDGTPLLDLKKKI
ncbi:MAG: tRNA (N6-threonylcarbamoyladenosine(37)-N6)-methyltransferase TrmO [Deltaproteobacteria bacterium RIFOXYD12_FULL_57_12]|nr:MAG: tRNA (N6-threonylcarbamoyladenosine(37)-N6)-methyltransferase TrmO [Deltaproteobacteria bacterium RIFOXYD12_FULL_57_12]